MKALKWNLGILFRNSSFTVTCFYYNVVKFSVISLTQVTPKSIVMYLGSGSGVGVKHVLVIK